MGPPLSQPHLHSRYDPIKEAARFLDAQTIFCVPSIVIVTEPGESHLAGELKNRYPEAKIIAIRYQDSLFTDSDCLWDAVWRPCLGKTVVSFLLDLIPDELLPVTVFFPWKPADSVWPDIARAVWNDIAALVRLQQSIMRTRAHFGKRWFSNMVLNGVRATRFMRMSNQRKPVLLAAAGPSLDRLYPFDRESFCLCAVSAAVKSLLFRQYIPDLCVATDGGFWAREHLIGIPGDIPVAFPLEAAIPSEILVTNPLIMLSYGSVLEREFHSRLGIAAIPAVRNGTVSGTAALLALSLTTDKVYAAGLDLAPSASFSHTRPYATDARSVACECRLSPQSNRLYEQNRETAALDAYALWFSSRDENFRKRFCRIASTGRPLEGIVSIEKRDIVNGHSECSPIVTDISVSSFSEKERIGIMDVFLGENILTLEAHIRGTDSDPELFSATLREDPVLAELVSTIAYGEFVRYLKRRSISRTSGDTRDSVRSVCLNVADYMRTVQKRFKRNG
jgi:hypothetical protein